jgi:hypothetical protein
MHFPATTDRKNVDITFVYFDWADDAFILIFDSTIFTLKFRFMLSRAHGFIYYTWFQNEDYTAYNISQNAISNGHQETNKMVLKSMKSRQTHQHRILNLDTSLQDSYTFDGAQPKYA